MPSGVVIGKRCDIDLRFDFAMAVVLMNQKASVAPVLALCLKASPCLAGWVFDECLDGGVGPFVEVPGQAAW